METPRHTYFNSPPYGDKGGGESKSLSREASRGCPVVDSPLHFKGDQTTPQQLLNGVALTGSTSKKIPPKNLTGPHIKTPQNFHH